MKAAIGFFSVCQSLQWWYKAEWGQSSQSRRVSQTTAGHVRTWQHYHVHTWQQEPVPRKNETGKSVRLTKPQSVGVLLYYPVWGNGTHVELTGAPGAGSRVKEMACAVTAGVHGTPFLLATPAGGQATVVPLGSGQTFSTQWTKWTCQFGEHIRHYVCPMVRFELSDENENFGISTASQYFTDFSDDVCGEIPMGVIGCYRSECVNTWKSAFVRESIVLKWPTGDVRLSDTRKRSIHSVRQTSGFYVNEHENLIGMVSDSTSQLTLKKLPLVSIVRVPIKNIRNELTTLFEYSSLFQPHLSLRPEFLHRLQIKQHIATDRMQKYMWESNHLLLSSTLKIFAKMKNKTKRVENDATLVTNFF